VFYRWSRRRERIYETSFSESTDISRIFQLQGFGIRCSISSQSQKQKMSRFIKSACKNCNGVIEFDAEQLAGATSINIKCPHCNSETTLIDPGEPIPVTIKKEFLRRKALYIPLILIFVPLGLIFNPGLLCAFLFMAIFGFAGYLLLKKRLNQPVTTGKILFKNPSNGYIEEVSRDAWLWVLLFGCVYFAIKGVWTHAIAGFLLAICTCGTSWLIYPLFAADIMKRHYLRKGWVQI